MQSISKTTNDVPFLLWSNSCAPFALCPIKIGLFTTLLRASSRRAASAVNTWHNFIPDILQLSVILDSFFYFCNLSECAQRLLPFKASLCKVSELRLRKREKRKMTALARDEKPEKCLLFLHLSLNFKQSEGTSIKNDKKSCFAAM